MASVLVPTLLPLDQRREIFALPNEDADMHVASSSSPVVVWWRTEPRLDLWVSAGALAFALCVVVLVLV